ncbi:hypothetical protein Zmor_021050 [Zophobas morio]|uniref:Uncharacterized protein n=2 Tax=Zophobas TaxID=7073 RepID=A0AA38MAR1_9CUCU|nr:hypothetical protein Zmor_021050 [Zophobas morio]UXO98089.1 neuropeptide F2 [Zophobas atratus]
MSTCKLAILLTVLLAVHLISGSPASSLCNRPLYSFETSKHVGDYLKCIANEASKTRYGKRAPPALIGKLRPYVYDYDLQQIQDLLYPEN